MTDTIKPLTHGCGGGDAMDKINELVEAVNLLRQQIEALMTAHIQPAPADSIERDVTDEADYLEPMS